MSALSWLWVQKALKNRNPYPRTFQTHFIRCSSCSSVSEEHLLGLSMSVCLSVCCIFLQTRQPAWPFLIVGTHYATMGTEVTVGTHCCDNGRRGHCLGTLTMGTGIIVGSQHNHTSIILSNYSLFVTVIVRPTHFCPVHYKDKWLVSNNKNCHTLSSGMLLESNHLELTHYLCIAIAIICHA
jgi:hypothetical protein